MSSSSSRAASRPSLVDSRSSTLCQIESSRDSFESLPKEEGRKDTEDVVSFHVRGFNVSSRFRHGGEREMGQMPAHLTTSRVIIYSHKIPQHALTVRVA